jgi:hypothetical protein
MAMTSDSTPIAYTALPKGTPVLDSAGHEFGTVEHVLQIPEEDLFDGLAVATAKGLRFVDSDSISSITTSGVECTLSAEQVTALPEPGGPPVYTVDALQDSGGSLSDRVGRLFRRPRWKETDED